MCSATDVEPTKLTAATSSCSNNARTASWSPCTTFSTPLGNPASAKSCASFSDVLGSRSLGFSTNVLPQPMATGNIHIGTMAGKLNGVMPTQTPTGCRNDQLSMSPPTLSLY